MPLSTSTIAPSPTATPTPSGTPTPSDGESGFTAPFGMLVSGAGGNMVSVLYGSTDPGSGHAAAPMLLATPPPEAVAIGDLDQDGSAELLVWSAVHAPQHGGLSVYAIEPDQGMVEVVAIPSDDGDIVPGSTRILIGDTDPELPGDEVVVTQLRARNRGAHIRIFGGFGDGDFRLLGSWSLFPKRALQPDEMEFALVEVVESHPGLELVASSPNGRLFVFDASGGRRIVLRSLTPFPDRPRANTSHFAVGDLIADHAGNEIAVGDDGTVGDGLVRVLDADRGLILAEFKAFGSDEAPAGVELWVGDVERSAGDEIIAGQGPAGGAVRLFSIATRVAKKLVDVPNSLGRTTSLRHHLVIADFLPTLPGKEIAVAQAAPSFPVQTFSFEARRATLRASVTAGLTGEVMSVVAGR